LAVDRFTPRDGRSNIGSCLPRVVGTEHDVLRLF
jgi:hypothetical protein